MSELQESFLNPARIKYDLMSKLYALSVPGIDVEAFMAGQRKNIEALAAASRTTMDSFGAVSKRQAEILQETLSQTARSLETLLKAGSPYDIAAKQAELTEEGFEKALGNMRELAEMVTKAQNGVLDAISRQVSESLEELKQLATKTAPPSAPMTKLVTMTPHTAG